MTAIPDKGSLAVSAQPIERTQQGLEYVRRLHADIMDWYNKADTKAQVILTLDAAFLTFVVTGILQNEQVVVSLPTFTLICLFLMAISLVVSIYSAIACIWARIHTLEHLREVMRESGVDYENYATYSPHTSWFFQYISALKIDEFEKLMSTIDIPFEMNALAYQTCVLSENVNKKYKHVNRGFVYAAISLFLLLLSAISFTLNIKGIC